MSGGVGVVVSASWIAPVPLALRSKHFQNKVNGGFKLFFFSLREIQNLDDTCAQTFKTGITWTTES